MIQFPYPNRIINLEKVITGQDKYYWLKRGSHYYPLDRVNISENVAEHTIIHKTKTGKKQKQILVHEDENGVTVKYKYRNRIFYRHFDNKLKKVINVPIDWNGVEICKKH